MKFGSNSKGGPQASNLGQIVRGTTGINLGQIVRGTTGINLGQIVRGDHRHQIWVK